VVTIIDFRYLYELQLFTQILMLGSILSVIVMYITELTKKIITVNENKTWIFTLICLAASMIFGIAWAKTFAYNSMSMSYALWLGLFLWLGSTGFYTKLEESSGFWGKTVQSYSKYLEKKLKQKQRDALPNDKNRNKKKIHAQPSDISPQQKYIVYTAVKGDTLYGLAARYDVDCRQIAYLNNIEENTQIYPGMILIIPVTFSAPDTE
jgi:hypothetical protein